MNKLSTIILSFMIMMTICLVMLVQQNTAYAQETANDILENLQSLEVGQIVPEQIINEASSLVKLTDGRVVLTYSSTDPSRLHRMIVDENAVLIEVNLVVNEAEKASIADNYRKVSEGKVVEVRKKVDSEELRGLPEEGIAFVVNPKNEEIERVIYFQPMSTSDFDITVASDFYPRERQPITPSVTETQSSLEESNASVIQKLGWLVGERDNEVMVIMLVVFLGLGMVTILFISRIRR